VKLLREDSVVGWIVFVFALSQLAAMGWDLPGSYGWENDGIAPRDFFAGIAVNLTPGQGHRYPLLHNLFIGVLCIPVLLPAVLRAEEWTLPALMEQILTVPTMTGCSIVAKLVGLLMACASVLAIARIARRTVSAEAGRWAAIWAATSLSFAYYGRVSNLDGPYLMWTALAIERLLTVAEQRQRKDYLIFGVLAGAAVATKDQAYAGFILPGLLYLVLLPMRSDRPFGPRGAHYANTGLATLAGLMSLGLLGGGLLNPSGFVTRVAELTGGASHDWMTYERSVAGVRQNLNDIAFAQNDFFWPWAVVALCWIGVVVVLLSPSDGGIRSRTFRLLPLSAGMSSLLFFTLVVARCEHRFLLPFGFWLSYYGGVCGAAILSRARLRSKVAYAMAATAIAALTISAAGHSLQVHLTQLGDARNEVSAYLAELEPGAVVETYYLLVHLPHFDTSDDSPYTLQRVSRRPIPRRNPLVGAKEIDEPYGLVNERRPDVLVVPEFTAYEFIPRELQEGEAAPQVLAQHQQDEDAQSFFRAIIEDELNGYEVAFIAAPKLPAWAEALGMQPVQVHASVGNRQWILRRSDR
jgi:hypothetical protein